MIKQGLSNFFKNLKYFFTPLGALFLGVLFGISFLFSGFKIQAKKLAQDIKEITAESEISIDDLRTSVINSFAEIDWKNPVSAIKTVTSDDWINGTLKVNLENTVENYKLYAHEIEDSVSHALSGFVKYILAFVFCAILGLIGGFFLTKFLIRRTIKKDGILKFILVTLFDSVLMLVVTALTLWLTVLWTPSIIISSIVGIVLYVFISLFEAYLTRSDKSLTLGEVVNMKNIISLFFSNCLIYLIAFAISVLAVALTNMFVGVFIALSFLILAIIVISLNAETCVNNLKKD